MLFDPLNTEFDGFQKQGAVDPHGQSSVTFHSSDPLPLFAKKVCRRSDDYFQPQRSRISAPSPMHFGVFFRLAHGLSMRSIDRDLDFDSPRFDLLEYFGSATVNFLFLFYFGLASNAGPTSPPLGIPGVRNGCVGKNGNKNM
jgi:hypothetical protein